MNMIERVARTLCDYKPTQPNQGCVGICDRCIRQAKSAIAAMRDPSDELLLALGEPYRIQKAVHVPLSEGIKLRRIAWNKIIDAALKEE